MKKHVLMIVSVLAAGVLAACGGIGPDAGGNGEVSDAGADPDAPILQTGGVVSATGIVVPSEEASLAFETGGQLVELNVEVGDEVQEGDVLARLDASILEAQIANAEASVGVAEANLDLVTAGPRDAQVAEQ
ncbi:MAG: biotin/lipoyl-binding protein, partial [Chloroflexi bacterium]|nr:biotin/lipoyl-binding protein [Chloroflexota bacterium]